MRGWTAFLVGTLLLLTPTIALAFEGNNANCLRSRRKPKSTARPT